MSQQRRNSLASSFVAIHNFNGSAAESQLTFRKGEIIFANAGQSGDWWWGAMQTNGGKVEGWFPPTYAKRRPAQVLAPVRAPAPAPAPAPQPVKRQVMAAPSATGESGRDIFGRSIIQYLRLLYTTQPFPRLTFPLTSLATLAAASSSITDLFAPAASNPTPTPTPPPAPMNTNISNF